MDASKRQSYDMSWSLVKLKAVVFLEIKSTIFLYLCEIGFLQTQTHSLLTLFGCKHTTKLLENLRVILGGNQWKIIFVCPLPKLWQNQSFISPLHLMLTIACAHANTWAASLMRVKNNRMCHFLLGPFFNFELNWSSLPKSSR